MMLLYTDGLNEAENPAKELFGDQQILDLMANAGKRNSSEVIDMIKAAVEKHRDGSDPNDDMTLLCLKLS